MDAWVYKPATLDCATWTSPLSYQHSLYLAIQVELNYLLWHLKHHFKLRLIYANLVTGKDFEIYSENINTIMKKILTLNATLEYFLTIISTY
jgi:hypothetical protein